MNALVGKLRRMAEDKTLAIGYAWNALDEAADEIERLWDVENADLEGLAHEIYAVAQLLPHEGITDAVDRIKECIISEANDFREGRAT